MTIHIKLNHCPTKAHIVLACTHAYLLDRVRCLAGSDGLRYLCQLFSKLLSVLCHLNGGDRRAQDLHIVLPQSTTLLQLDATVESGLTTKGEKDPVRTLALDHLSK